MYCPVQFHGAMSWQQRLRGKPISRKDSSLQVSLIIYEFLPE